MLTQGDVLRQFGWSDVSREWRAQACVYVFARLTAQTFVRYGSEMSKHEQVPYEYTDSADARASRADTLDATAVVYTTGVRDYEEGVIRRYESAVRKFCRSRTATPDDADDAVQDTFLRFLRRSEPHLRNDEAWLIRAASRACIDIHRRRTRAVEHEAVGLYPADVTDRTGREPERLIVEELAIGELLRGLTERERVIVTHLYLLGSTLKQVAAYLGVSPEHAKVIAFRARRHARSLVTRDSAK